MLVGHMPGRASGWISFFVIAESSELILCSMLETETTESMIIEWGRAVIEQVLLLDLPELWGSGQSVSWYPRLFKLCYACYNVNWTVHRTI